jgi:NADH dehydrogenase
MSARRAVIVGGGFAGIRCLVVLRRRSPSLHLTLIDPVRESVFRPLLPDVIAGKIGLGRLLLPFDRFCSRNQADFVNEAAERIDGGGLLLASGRRVPFDQLVVACGAGPAFFGNEAARRTAFTLYSAADAVRLQERTETVLSAGRPHTFVVVGGGYTGLETATAIAWRIGRAVPAGKRRIFPVRIVELAPRILGRLPDRFALPAGRETARMGIEIAVSAKIGAIAPEAMEIDGATVRDFTLIWSAGVAADSFVRGIDSARDRQGRLLVGPDLRLPGRENVYALGDCASVSDGKDPLRMAVQFSRGQGETAALNILRRMRGDPPLAYRPRDWGWLIPIASWRAWGEALGRPVGGRRGAFLHYALCVHRTHRVADRIGIVVDLLRALFLRDM